ncbi:MAG TPA: Tad domain-containing protein, partial [bacterium]|nr:Tad domain-containing protein [bacterium]
LSKVNSEKGSVTALVVFAVPLFVAMLGLVVEGGRVALARARLQAAVDRAAYAGAAVVTHAFNEIASDNWRIHKAWRDLSEDFGSDTQQDEDAARQRFELYEEERDAALHDIESQLETVEERAEEAALETFEANAPLAEAGVSTRVEVELDDDLDRDEQWGKPGYGYVTGPIFTDPESVESGEFEALKFLVKRPGEGASVGVFGSQKLNPLVMPGIFGPAEVRAASASQAYGGSIEGFARKETATLSEAEGEEGGGGADGLYRATLVPAWTLGEEGEGMMH